MIGRKIDHEISVYVIGNKNKREYMQMISPRLDCLGEAINIPILAWAVAHAVYCCVIHLGRATCAFRSYLLE